MVEGRAYSPEPLWYHLTFYPFHLLAIALPWTPLIALALVGIGRRNGFTSPLVRFLVCWALAPVVVFTPAEWKLRYYLLPSLPALALLAAPLAADLATRPLARPRPTPASLVLAGRRAARRRRRVGDALAAGPAVALRPGAHRPSFPAAVPGHAAAGRSRAATIVGMVGATVALRLWGPPWSSWARSPSAGSWSAAAVDRRRAADASSARSRARSGHALPAPAPLCVLRSGGAEHRRLAGRPIPSLAR
jgi:4-amino-4-deoxy-L-arabinose transferase-like glycosyltransferase